MWRSLFPESRADRESLMNASPAQEGAPAWLGAGNIRREAGFLLLWVGGIFACSFLYAQSKLTSAVQAQPPTKPQPIPFSHKLHTQFVAECQGCHEMSASGWEMGYPVEAQCMQCHASIKTGSPAIRKLAEFYNQKKSVPWQRVYQVPDYVFFSHKVHIKKAKLECEICHGPVSEREVLTKEKPTSMEACVDCHRERGAPVNCRTCHNR
jgi:hypothetical protein